MEKGMKSVFILALLLIIVGAIILILALSANDWRLGTSNYETTEFEINDTVQDISISANTDDIVFLRAEDGKGKVVFYEHKSERHYVKILNGKVNIGVKNEKKWWENMFNTVSPKMTIYLPAGEYGALKIESDTGDISIPSDFSFESINIALSTGDTSISGTQKIIKISVSTGDVSLDGVISSSIDLSASTGDMKIKNVNCEGDIATSVSTGDIEIIDTSCHNFTSKGSTGELDISGSVASGVFTIERSTGDITFNRSDASEIYITASTADIEGTLLSDKIFIISTDTGSVKVPESTTGGKFKCETSTGDVKISIVK